MMKEGEGGKGRRTLFDFLYAGTEHISNAISATISAIYNYFMAMYDYLRLFIDYFGVVLIKNHTAEV